MSSSQRSAIWLLAFTALLSFPLCGFWEGDQPKVSASEALFRSYKSFRRIPMELVQTRQSLSEKTPAVVKIAVGKRAAMRIDILRPLVREGTVSIDNGRDLRTFLPDLNVVQSMASPYLYSQDPKERVKLLESNYSLEIGKGPKVAGRSTYRILIEPKNQHMTPQKVFLDAEKFTHLRVEAVNDEGEDHTLIDTLHIRYGMPPAKFETPKDVPEIKQWGPYELSRVKDGIKRLGFTPKSPKKLPFGFSPLVTQITGSPDKPYCVTRITDGLVSVSVFQWSIRVHGSVSPARLNPVYTKDGVQFAATGEAPSEVSRTLLSTYVLER